MATDANQPAVHPERARAEESYAHVEGHLTAADDAELGDTEEFRSLAWAQVHLLRAIYHELRYGNDQAVKLAKENADALSEHADTLDHVSSAMRGLGDSLDRHR
jgi:hypothetical protein